MVDAGLSQPEAFLAMAKIGIRPDALSAILLSHNHGDHVRGAEKICAKLRIPLYCSAGTAKAMAWATDVPKLSIFQLQVPISIGSISVVPFPVPHDAAEPVGFWFTDGQRKISIATDLGEVTEDVSAWMLGSDLVMIESSYEPALLADSKHHDHVRRRLASGEGHLSNDQACDFIGRLDERTSMIILAHVSEVANSPDIAMARARRAMNGYTRRLVLATKVLGEAL
jgi:phosphoribosyl 1,2-cyclic phosphodiesterase